METIVPIEELAGVIKQLQQEGYDSIVVFPLSFKIVECYAQPRLRLGVSSRFLENDTIVVKDYHVIASKTRRFGWLRKMFK